MAIFPSLNQKKYELQEIAAFSSALNELAIAATPNSFLKKKCPPELLDGIRTFEIISEILKLFFEQKRVGENHCRLCYRHAARTGLCFRHKLNRGLQNQKSYNRAIRIFPKYESRLAELMPLHAELSYGVNAGLGDFDVDAEYDPQGMRGMLFTRLCLMINEFIGDLAEAKLESLIRSIQEKLVISKEHYHFNAFNFWQEWYRDCVDDPLGADFLRSNFDANEIAADLLRLRAWNEVGGNEVPLKRGRKTTLDHARIIALRKEGKSYREIAAAVGAGSPESIRRIVAAADGAVT